MSNTPESKIKAMISAVLKEPDIYYFMPVQTGYGAAGLDYHCAIKVRNVCVAFWVEAKKPGGKTTPRQDELIDQLRGISAKVFVVEDWIGVRELKEWLEKLRSFSALSD